MEERETKGGRGGKRVRDRGTEGRGGTEEIVVEKKKETDTEGGEGTEGRRQK